jgi:hypothetical protein
MDTTLKAGSDAFTDLLDILQQENIFLKEGRLREAAGLATQKIEALDLFDANLGAQSRQHMGTQHKQTLKRIVSLSEENAAHFIAIRNGLKSVISRLEQLERSEASVGAYDRLGGRVEFQSQSGKLTKRL